MANNVYFRKGTLAQYQAIEAHDINTLYWLTDVQELRNGDALFGKGTEATPASSGLMSAADKTNLDRLVLEGFSLEPVDQSIVIQTSTGKKSIGVQLSAVESNAIVLKDDGLFVSAPVVPEYAVVKDDEAAEGYAATYHLQKTTDGHSEFVGAAINIPKDMVVKSGSVKTVEVDDQPYEGARVGDVYIDLVLNNDQSSHVYIPANKLVDVYTAGAGIEIESGVVSVKISNDNANGLTAVDGSIGLNLATRSSAGAMSAVDKTAVDSLPYAFKKVKYFISNRPNTSVVDYREKEVRLMCAANTDWRHQQVGAKGDANNYYIGFRAYAPSSDVVSFKEDMAQTISDETMYYFEGNEFAGIDEFGRKYSIVWLPVASYDESTQKWTYFGTGSGDGRYIGWYYSVEWYDADGHLVDKDTTRITLSNEACHTSIEPFYMYNYAKASDIAKMKEDIEMIQASIVWSEI